MAARSPGNPPGTLGKQSSDSCHLGRPRSALPGRWWWRWCCWARWDSPAGPLLEPLTARAAGRGLGAVALPPPDPLPWPWGWGPVVLPTLECGA